METLRESWTDERLDDLSDRMGRGFEQAAVERREIRAEFRAEMKELRAETRELFATMERRFDSLQQTLLLGAAGVIASLVGLIATQL